MKAWIYAADRCVWIPVAAVISAAGLYTLVRCCQLWRRRREVIEHKRFLTEAYISRGKRIPSLLIRFYRQDMARYLNMRDGCPQRWFIRRKPLKRFIKGC